MSNGPEFPAEFKLMELRPGLSLKMIAPVMLVVDAAENENCPAIFPTVRAPFIMLKFAA
jgi:hypothetical protein